MTRGSILFVCEICHHAVNAQNSLSGPPCPSGIHGWRQMQYLRNAREGFNERKTLGQTGVTPSNMTSIETRETALAHAMVQSAHTFNARMVLCANH
jgi:hypothetical protein